MMLRPTYSVVKIPRMKLAPPTRKIQPIGLPGRRMASTAPTDGSATNAVATAITLAASGRFGSSS
jgi:hypothetical protein